MKSEIAILKKLNRYHEKLVIKLSKALAAEKAKNKRLRERRDRHGKN